MFRKDLKLIVSEKRFLFFSLILLAVTMIAVIFGSQNRETPKVSLGVCDNDNSQYSVLLVDYFKQNEVFTSYIEIVEESEDELERLFFEGKLDVYLVIPKDFAENLIKINNMPMKAVINSADPTKAVVYKTLLESYGQYISAVELNCQALYDIMDREGYPDSLVDEENFAVSYDLIFTALGKDEFYEIKPSERIKGISLVNYYIYSALMFLVLYCGTFAGLGLLRDKLSKVRLRMESIGNSKVKMTLSKSFAYTLICGGMVLISLIIVNLFSRFSFPAVSVISILLSIFISSLFFCVLGNVFKSEGGYIVFTNMLILLLTIVGGGIIPVMYLPEAIARVARFTPNYWFIKMLL